MLFPAIFEYFSYCSFENNFSINFTPYFFANKNARIESFLNKLDLKSHLIEEGMCAAKEAIKDTIDWKYVKGLLEKEKEISLKFIQENCGKE